MTVRVDGGGLDADHKKASRLAHLPAPMLNSWLVLSALVGKADSMQSPYAALGRLQPARKRWVDSSR